MFKKFISLILVLAICIACFSSVAFAGTGIVLQTTENESFESEEIQEEKVGLEESMPAISDLDVNKETESVISEELKALEEPITEGADEMPTNDNENSEGSKPTEQNETMEDTVCGESQTNNLTDLCNDTSKDTEIEKTEVIENHIFETEKETTEEIDTEENINTEIAEDEASKDGEEESVETIETVNNEAEKNDDASKSESDTNDEIVGQTEDVSLQQSSIVLDSETVSEQQCDFFSVYDNERTDLEQYINFLCGDCSSVSYNYTFLGNPVSVVGTTERLISFAHNYEANLATNEMLIALYDTFVEDSSINTEIDIVFSASDDESLFLRLPDGRLMELTSISSYGEDGKKIARLKLSNEDYSSVAYFSIPYCNVNVFKLSGKTETSDIAIHSVTVTGAPKSYAVARLMEEECDFSLPVLGIGAVSNNDNAIALEYSIMEDGVVNIHATSNTHVYVLDGHARTVEVIANDLEGFVFEDFIPTEDPQTAIERALKEAEDEKKDNDKTDDPNATTEGAIELNTEATTDAAIEVASDAAIETVSDAAIENIPDATPVEIAETVDSNASTSEAQAIEEIFEESTSEESKEVIEEPEESEEQSPAEEKKEEEIQTEEQQDEQNPSEVQEQKTETEPEPENPSSDDIPEDTNVVPEEAPADASLIPAETPIENETISTSEVSSAVEGATLIVELGTIETAPQYTDASVI